MDIKKIVSDTLKQIEPRCHEISAWEVYMSMCETEISAHTKVIRNINSTPKQVSSSIAAKAQYRLIIAELRSRE